MTDTLPGLLEASFRGIAFFVPDTSVSAGRRLVEHLFPGIDPAAYDDFGQSPRRLSVSGLILGDDYVAQAKALQAAFERPGPGTLVHPWLGPISVLLEEPGDISFDAGKLRTATFRARFKRFDAASSGSSSNTAAAVQSAAAALSTIVGRIIAFSDAASRSALEGRAVRRAGRSAAAARVGLTTIAGFGAIAEAGSAAGLAAAIEGVLTAAATRSVETHSDRIVALAAEAGTDATVPTPNARAASALAACETLACMIDQPSTVDRRLTVAAASLMASAAAGLSLHMTYDDRAEAFAALAGFESALTTLADAAALSDDGPMREAVRASAGLSAAIADDINEIIGRLPKVSQLRLGRTGDAWLIAHHLHGDRPAEVEDGYREIVRRNRPRNPATIEAGTVEVVV